MVYSTYKLQRILYFYFQGFKAPTISKLLREEKLKASRVGIAKFLKKYEETGSIGRRPGSGRLTKVTAEIKAVVEEQMRKDDETTATQLHALLTSRGYSISLRTILRCRFSLGRTYRGSAYCQLIRDANKQKRLAWAEQFGTYKDEDFEEVIWTDECTYNSRLTVTSVVENVESRLGQSQGKYSSSMYLPII
jgi:transposase